jgi:hypothetical protein
MKDVEITVFRNLYKSTDVPYIITLENVIKRIKEGKKKDTIDRIRKVIGTTEYTSLKSTLPAILFQGVFSQRKDDACNSPSGLMIHDYDKFESIEELQETLILINKNPSTVFSFISPGGNGIKALVKIPKCDKRDYKRYFSAYHKEFNYPNFDISSSNISRVCFESYDPDCYVNYKAETYNPKLLEEGYSYTEKTPILPLSDEEKIINMIMKWNWKSDFVEGERNQYIFNLSSAFCEYGISKEYAKGYIDNNIRFGDFSEREMNTAIESAYRSRSFKSKYFEDYDKKNKIQSDLGSPKETVLKRYNISEDVYDDLKKEYEHDDFWYYEEDKKGVKIKLDILKYKYFLESNGFKKYFLEGSDKPTFVFVESNKVEETSVSRIKDFVLNYLLLNGHNDVWTKCVNYQILFNENYLNLLESIELSMLKDKKDKSFIAFRNGILEITKNNIKIVDYIDVEGYIWKSQIIERDFVLSSNDNQYKTFIYNISNSDPLPFECTIGYLLHGYKNKMNNKAIILNDEIISDNSEGGTGKGLVIQGLKQIRKTSILDGKSFDDKKSFPYQTVSSETQLLVFDDVKKNFDFESKFSLVTEGMTLERKNKDAIKLTIEESPKLIITTNYAIKGEGNSHDRRRHELEVSQYYSKSLTPYLEFNCQLFDDWDLKEFKNFDNYMANCIQSYLKIGLPPQNAKNLKLRKLIAESSMEFFEWISEGENFILNNRNEKGKLFSSFTNDYKDFQKWLSRKKFNIWIQKYASYIDAKFEQGNTQGIRWVMIIEKGKNELEPTVDF